MTNPPIAVLVSENGDVTKLDSDDALPVARDYDFNRGDERRMDFNEAVAAANRRAYETGADQQVRLVSGPLLATKIWLIQSVDGGIVRMPIEGPTTLGTYRRLVHRSKHLPDSTPVGIEMEAVPEGVQFFVVAHDTR